MNVAVPLQKLPDSHTCPNSCSQVSSWIWKFSTNEPCGKTNMLSGISSLFSVSFWM